MSHATETLTIPLSIPGITAQTPIDIPLTKDGDNESWRGSLTILHTPFHIEAVPVCEDDGVIMTEASEDAVVLEAYDLLAVDRPGTITILGKPHVLLIYPYSSSGPEIRMR